MKEKKYKNILDNKKFLFVASLLLAVLVWIIIAGFIATGDGETTRVLSIDYTRGESIYKNNNLVMVGDVPSTVRVTLSGSQSVIWALQSSDVSVYLDYNAANITGPNTYEVPLAYRTSSSVDYNVVGLDPQSVEVRFETLETKTLTVVAQAPGIEAQEGYFKDTLVISPQTVEISGPSSDVAKVQSIVANVPDEEVRNSSKYSTVTLQLLDASGAEVDTAHLTLSNQQAEVEIPILEIREYPVQVTYSGVPQGFDLAWLESLTTLSFDTIQITGKTEDLNKMTAVEVGPIDLSTFEIGERYDLPITLGSAYKIYDQSLKSVQVSFDDDNLVTKTFEITGEASSATSNIRLVNVPPGIEITPQEEKVVVTLIGPADVLEGLLPENIVVEIEAYGITAAAGGQQRLPARVIIAGSNQVFATGTYTVLCDVQVE